VNPIALGFAVATVADAIVRRGPEDRFFLWLVIPSFLIIGRFEKKSIHYFIFLYPTLAVFIGRFASHCFGVLKTRSLRTMGAVFLVASFLVHPTLLLSKMVRRDLSQDNRTKAIAWIYASVPAGRTLALNRFIFTGIRDKYDLVEKRRAMKQSGNPFASCAERLYDRHPAYRLVDITEFDDDTLAIRSSNADFIVLTTDDFARFFVSDPRRIPEPNSPLADGFQKKKRFFAFILNGTRHPFRLCKTLDGVAGPTVTVYRNTDTQTGSSFDGDR